MTHQAAMPMTDRTMSPEQRVDGVVLEYLEHEWHANRQRRLPGRIVTETGLPRPVVARSIQRLRKLGWIAWETVPINRQPGWRPTSLGAMVAADHPRPYWQDENGTTWESREDATEHGPATEVIMTPSEFARLPEA